jgi:hypothetical protein
MWRDFLNGTPSVIILCFFCAIHDHYSLETSKKIPRRCRGMKIDSFCFPVTIHKMAGESVFYYEIGESDTSLS